ncbi:putative histone h1.3 [Aspergillus glaucus CBS 516.65]|uniref:Uncharacterized protein n=1 Tax=Aspergillus glaucus CBS 516.65 TaxID=1160497 RepID=A0A1L9VZD0_ASPGL|nr:hypothetical protein ASPGLDRAFT_21408 [Aspergillus glaucus CBS 516.65]OJJ89271.1 hypothetical protein ASPGLDRAFT_21408 [Aspergillus glaucus CBS 516.65]
MSGRAKSDATLGLSPSETKLMLLAGYFASEQQKMDYEKLAQMSGYKNGATANTVYRNAKRKLAEYIATNPANGGGASSTPDDTPSATPKKAPTKRKTAAKGGEDNRNGGVEESPTKQKKQRTPAKEAKVKEFKDESGDEPSTPSARPLKMEDELFPYVKLENCAA